MDIKKIIEKVSQNWPAKVISLVLAIFLFEFHHIDASSEKTLNKKLTIHNSQELTLAKQIGLQNIKLTVSGNKEDVDSSTEDDFEVFIDLEEYKTIGHQSARVQLLKTGNAQGISINLDPKVIEIELDRIKRKSLPVIPKIEGQAAKGYSIVSEHITPSHVIVQGPESLVDKISSLDTEPIDLEGSRVDIYKVVTIVTPEPLIVLVGSSQAAFNAVIGSVNTATRQFGNLIINAVNIPNGFSVELDVKTVTVTLDGIESELSEILLDGNFLTVDCSGINDEGEYDLPVSIMLPDSVKLVSVFPETVSVEIKKVN
ncbi:hypothetical protein AGMMS50212_02070 [Spirochaetia bacterium]|nr:hypothetical protein AGMMS50212_02070 [Spirochaetia bacterium]